MFMCVCVQSTLISLLEFPLITESLATGGGGGGGGALLIS